MEFSPLGDVAGRHQPGFGDGCDNAVAEHGQHVGVSCIEMPRAWFCAHAVSAFCERFLQDPNRIGACGRAKAFVAMLVRMQCGDDDGIERMGRNAGIAAVIGQCCVKRNPATGDGIGQPLDPRRRDEIE